MMWCGLLAGLLAGQPGSSRAETHAPGEPVNGLQLQLELVEAQPETFRVNDPVLVRLVISNVGSRLLRLYRGRWTDAPKGQGPRGGMLRAVTLDLTNGGSVLQLEKPLPAIDRQVLWGEVEVVPPVAPEGVLRKLIELRFPASGRYDVVMVVTFTAEDYAEHVTAGHLTAADLPQAWVGTVISSPLTIHVTGKDAH